MSLRKTLYLETQKYVADYDRDFISADLQAGVYRASDYAVTFPGAGMTPSIAVGRALIPGRTGVSGPSAGPYQGLYYQVNDAALSGPTLANNSSGFPRVDQILLVGNDSANGSSNDTPYIAVAQGAPSSTATIDNRTGAVADASLTTTYGNWLRLADALVPNGATTPSVVRDRRPWVRGFNGTITRTQNASGGNDYTTTSVAIGGAAPAIDATNLAMRGEFSGGLVRVTLRFSFTLSSANWGANIWVLMDGALAASWNYLPIFLPNAGSWDSRIHAFEFTPAAGSHLFVPVYSVGTPSGPTLTLVARSAGPVVQFTVEESVRPSANNGTS